MYESSIILLDRIVIPPPFLSDVDILGFEDEYKVCLAFHKCDLFGYARYYTKDISQNTNLRLGSF